MTTFIGVSPGRMLGEGGEKELLVEVDADCLGGGELEAIL